MSDRRQSPPRFARGGFVGGEKARDFKGTFRKFMGRFGQFKLTFIFVILFAIGSTAFSIIGPEILGTATTQIYEGIIRKLNGTGGINFEAIGNILLTLLGLYTLSAIFNYVKEFLMSRVSQTIAYNLRKEMSEKINRLPMKYFDTRTHGEILSRFVNDIDSISMNLNHAMTQIINSVVTILGVLIMMFSISPIMTFSVLLVLPISTSLIRLIVKKSQKYYNKQQAYLGHVNGEVEEVYGGHIVIKAYNKQEDAVDKFNGLNNILYDSGWKSQFVSGLMMPLMSFIGNISYVLVAILGGYLAIVGNIKVGQIQSFIQYVRSFNMPINQSAQITNMLQTTVAAAERVFELLEEDEEEQLTQNPLSIENIKGDVTFKNVNFGYNEKPVITNFSADINKGQKIAIVGPTGAGKTTIVKLLMRFYDLQSGRIFVDGNDINDFNRGDLRKIFGMVLQDTWLFNDTIMENIRYGRLTASDEEVIAAAKAAHVHHFIQTLPGGYQMVLNEDATNISQGQKQLLTIARAILADPPILILDEATSSVDTRTEVQIQNAMDALMKGRTSFIIAHRLSTIRNADRILVMNEGNIIEQGSHNELLKQGGFYRELYMSQFENAG